MHIYGPQAEKGTSLRILSGDSGVTLLLGCTSTQALIGCAPLPSSCKRELHKRDLNSISVLVLFLVPDVYPVRIVLLFLLFTMTD